MGYLPISASCVSLSQSVALAANQAVGNLDQLYGNGKPAKVCGLASAAGNSTAITTTIRAHRTDMAPDWMNIYGVACPESRCLFCSLYSESSTWLTSTCHLPCGEAAL